MLGGNNVAFSVLSLTTEGEPRSAVWALNGIEGIWKRINIDFTALNKEQLERYENVVSAVAFPDGDLGQSLDQHLITGRLNGALYCGNKRLEKYPDESPVRQIYTNHSKPGNKGGYWFVYRHQSGEVLVRQCNSAIQEENSFTKGKKKNISFISMNYIPTGIDKPVKPVVAFVNDTNPECWRKDDKWTSFDCISARFVKQFAIAPDAKHLVDVEARGKSVLKFPQEILSEVQKQLNGRLSGEHLIVWPKEAAVEKDHPSDQSKTSWKSEPQGSNRFMAQLSPGVEILKAAISPSGKYIGWLERKSMSSYEIDLYIYDIKANKDIELQGLLNIKKDNINTFDLAVTDNGLIVLAINDKLKLFKLNGGTFKEVDLKSDHDQAETGNNVDPITCLNLSPDNEKLVIGTQGGGLRTFNLSKLSFEKAQPKSGYISEGSSKDFVTACAVDNTGMMVGGFGDGNVRVVIAGSPPSPDSPPSPPSPPFQLTPQAVYQSDELVKAVSIDSQRGYVAALSDWQTSGCTAKGLPGQSIRIWGGLENKKPSLISWVPKWLVSKFESGEQFPVVSVVSNICLPNRRVMTIGSIDEKNNKLFLPVAFDDGVGSIPCRGCANKSEKPEDVLEILLKEAENKKAEIFEDKELEERYGIKF